ncbi:MAG: hypothetical protein LUO80_11740, partial [Methylococcaceae bacterium]|nr:hypothetical protein [Methylococcaceae bacterium]
MKLTRRQAAFGMGLSALGITVKPALALDGPIMDVVEGTENFAVASDAYVFGYPLVTMEMTRRVISNVDKLEGTRAPMGTLIKLRQYPDATFRDVTAPN